jgi:hypothetical protein
MKRIIQATAAILFASGAALSACAWYDRYWLWRDCFNEIGRCYNPESQQVYLEQAGLVWGMFTGACLAVAALLAWRAWR